MFAEREGFASLHKPHPLSCRRRPYRLKPCPCGTYGAFSAPAAYEQARRFRVRKKPRVLRTQSFISAEREGFEPPEPFSSTVFKTAVIDHSTTSPYVPKLEHYSLNSNRVANIVIFRIVTNYFQLFNCCYIASILHSALILYILVVTVTLLQFR